jgi:hypothetical protein
MKRPLALVAIIIAVAAGFFLSQRSDTIPESEVPLEVREAVYDLLRSKGCARRTDGTWKCPDGAI